jgi:hypothetical protein
LLVLLCSFDQIISFIVVIPTDSVHFHESIVV